MTRGGDRIAAALRRAIDSGRPAIAAFIAAGFPSRRAFPSLLSEVAAACDVVEVGIPFSDPMADGITIQRASRVALAGGASLAWALEAIAGTRGSVEAPVVLMSYVNPLLAYGIDRLSRDAAGAGISGFIVADLPFEERRPVRTALHDAAIGLVQMVTPATPEPRLTRLAAASEGFVYAVTVTGTTGGRLPEDDRMTRYLARVRAASTLPVLAGFGVACRADVSALVPPAHGVVIGSALIAALERGESAASFLTEARP